MVADDVTETRRSTRLMLTLIPNVEIVAIAKNGREAVELARQHKPDIALMDVNMPQMNGLECIRHIRALRPDVRILVVSALADKDTAIQALKEGAQGFLCKPFTEKDLTDAITELLDTGDE